MALLTDETIAATRQHFVNNALACIEEVLTGEVWVSDVAKYCADCQKRADEHRAGKWDHTLTFRQYATYIQTGQMPALLP